MRRSEHRSVFLAQATHGRPGQRDRQRISEALALACPPHHIEVNGAAVSGGRPASGQRISSGGTRLTTNTRTAQERAEASFKKKEKQLAEGQKAWAEYEANALAVREKTARLRALRLAHETRQGGQNSPPEIASAPARRKGRP
jgi:hypothetical protein